jgi:hypothetical protein
MAMPAAMHRYNRRVAMLARVSMADWSVGGSANRLAWIDRRLFHVSSGVNAMREEREERGTGRKLRGRKEP